MKTPKELDIALVVVAAVLLIAVFTQYKADHKEIVQKETNQAPATSEKCIQLPALSEKDVKLIEAFVHEMNLLNAVLFSDSSTFEAQRAKLDAASSDLSSLGSSNYPMVIMGNLAMRVYGSYMLVRFFSSSFSSGIQKLESQNNASQSRENFIEAYHMFQRGTTALEVNKFLEDKVKNESTSK